MEMLSHLRKQWVRLKSSKEFREIDSKVEGIRVIDDGNGYKYKVYKETKDCVYYVLSNDKLLLSVAQ